MATERTSLEDLLALAYRVAEAHQRARLRLRRWAHHDHDAATLDDIDEADEYTCRLRAAIRAHYEKYHVQGG